MPEELGKATLEELAANPLLQGIEGDYLNWIKMYSRVVGLEAGEVYYRQGERVDEFYIMLEGELQIAEDKGTEVVILGTTPIGTMGGEIWLLNDIESYVTATAIMPSRLLVFTEHAFRNIFAVVPLLGKRIFATASERTMGRAYANTRQEKMAALGQLSAGLAHELNNPASAVHRASDTLRTLAGELQEATLNLAKQCANPEIFDYLIKFQRQVREEIGQHTILNPLVMSEREDELADWLDEHEVDNAWELAPMLVSAGVNSRHLERMLELVPEQVHNAVVDWLAKALTSVEIIYEIEHASQRISELVKAVKEYTYMDRERSLQPTDLHRLLDNTITVLKFKLRGIEILRRYDPEMPLVMANGGELNQVWTNIIDNAVDALRDMEADVDGDHEHMLSIITRCENQFAMVEITDNGPGIPKEVQPHIFEPFFTTKDVGSGTGLGLDTTYRIIRGHKGTIEVRSQPGQTRFIVRLPIGNGEDAS